MHEIIKRDIISVLLKAADILSSRDEKDIADLKDLSNHTVHNASVFQDEFSISVAILIYSLSKVIERKKDKTNYGIFIDLLGKSKRFLEEGDLEGYNKNIKKMFSLISKIDDKLGMYVSEVVNQAQIKKGSKLYEHGISMARAAEILGVSQWDLMNYIGKTNIAEFEEKISSIDKRLKFTRGLFS